MIIPDYCYALNNMTIDPKTGIGKVIKIKAFERGYYPTEVEETQEFVDMYNIEQLGVDRATSRAMETASMFGWDTYLNMLESFRKLEK